MALPFDSQAKYDVFLSFRGEDTRKTFTSHLYAALCRNKIKTFIDDEEITRGDQISPTLLAAIESSKISIIVLSKNYASSSWCLDELQRIIECKKTKNHVVIPIFYNIDPSDVRHQRGTFEHAFAKHEERFKDNVLKVQTWREALQEVANSSGWDSSNIRLESELVEKIVGDVLRKLNHMAPQIPKGLVGITRQIAHVESLLCIESTDVLIIVIWGMGGIGKTTIAEFLYTKLSSQYEGSSFIPNVREQWQEHRELDLKNKLLIEILGDSNLNSSTRYVRSNFGIGRLQSKKLLIILDDVSDSKQIEYLVGGKELYGPGSRIILTTRDRDVCKKEADEVYQVRELNFHEALELFSLNAFQNEQPLMELRQLSEMVVNYANGLPLALKVLGSFLYSKQLKEWESALEKFQKYQQPKVYDVLRMSYEGLDPEEKCIFLDIACGLKGHPKCQIISLLNGCGFSINIGIRSLQDKSLIFLSDDQKVYMHDLIQQMGRQIVREESRDPGKRSRLWDPKEIYDVLKHNRGTETIESIWLDMSQIKDVTISPHTFDKMNNLRLLNFHLPSFNISNVHISGGLDCIPDGLSYLRWDCFPLKSLPSSFCAENLVELDIKDGLLEKLWDGMQDLVNLKSLFLIGCKNLIELPDFSKASKLEEVYLVNCISLFNVPSSIFLLDSLSRLSLRGCKQLRCIQSDTPCRSLQSLDLSGCSRLARFSVSSKKLNCLFLNGTAIEEFPTSVGQFKNRCEIYLYGCKRLKFLPSTFYEIGLDCTICLYDCPLEKLPPICDTSLSISHLVLDGCSNLLELPDNLGLLSALNSLSIGGSNIENLPSSIKYLSKLRYLNVSNCKRLLSLPELPFLLENLAATNCISLEVVSNSGIKLLQDSFGRLKKRSLLKQIQEEENMSIRRPYSFGSFEFCNCINLNQIAHDTLIEEALLRIQQAAYLSSKTEECYDPNYQMDEVSEKFDSEDLIYICRGVLISLPGSEVPNWFMHKRINSMIITLKLSVRWNRCLGFAFCLVLGPSHSNWVKNYDVPCMVGCRYYFGDGYASIFRWSFSFDNVESDHVCLWYDKLVIERIIGHITPCEKLSFEFFVEPWSSGLVVKQCGIRPLYAPNDITQGSNDLAGKDGKRPYLEYDVYGIQSNSSLFCPYAHPPDGLRIPYHDAHFGKPFLSIGHEFSTIDVRMVRNHFNGIRVTGSFGPVGCPHGFIIPHDDFMIPFLREKWLPDDYFNLYELLDIMNDFQSLWSLTLDGCNVEMLPPSINYLPKLKKLSLWKCKRLRSIPKLPSSLQSLFVVNCTSLETIELATENMMVFHGNSPNLKASMIYEKVSTVEIFDPIRRVTELFMNRLREDLMFVEFYFYAYKEPWNVACKSGTIEVYTTW